MIATWRGSAAFGLSSPKTSGELKSNKTAAAAILISFHASTRVHFDTTVAEFRH